MLAEQGFEFAHDGLGVGQGFHRQAKWIGRLGGRGYHGTGAAGRVGRTQAARVSATALPAA